MSFNAAGKHLFYTEFAKLTEAGFGIRQAADALQDDSLPASQKAILAGLHAGLENGQTISQALTGTTPSFTEFERSIIDAGERGGKLGASFKHLADYFGMIDSARSDALRALAYPAFILHLGVFVGTVPTAIMAGDQSILEITGSFLLSLLILYAGLAVAFIAILALFRNARKNPATDALLRRIPLIGKTRTHFAMASFSKVAHTCLLAGLPFRETIRMACAASQSGLILNAATSLSQTLDQGNPLGPVLTRQSTAFPKSFARAWTTGEQAGTLDDDLAHWSSRFQKDAATGIRTLAAVIPRILYIAVLLFVGWKIVAFFHGYYSGMLEMLE
ncbi:MAG: type II secretion system F family protein [Verrucomicrobiales bacterium]|nr:type II secretion system F family protein [Verrucomicrobiota bacterium JB025]